MRKGKNRSRYNKRCDKKYVSMENRIPNYLKMENEMEERK